MRTFTLILFLMMMTIRMTHSADWYVASGASGSGSIGSPGSFTTALAGTGWASSISAGDTVWLRAGTYTGVFNCDLSGTTNAPIVFRAYPDERVILDGAGLYGTQTQILRVDTSNVWFWGIEVISSNTDRWSDETGSGPVASQLARPNGVEVLQSAGVINNIKFINMIVRDTRQGFSLWTNSHNTEVYGCIVYNNGWESTDRGHGHAIYMQNDLSPGKYVANGFFGYQYSQGIEIYGSGASRLNNFTITSNSAAYNGMPLNEFTTQIMVGGDSVVTNATVIGNDTYAGSGTLFRLGYNAESLNSVVTGNYFTGDGGGVYFTSPQSMTMTGNAFHSLLISGISTSSYPNNVYALSDPVANTNFFRKNHYETNKAFVAVYNWSALDNVSVDASQLLGAGDQYRLRNSMNFWGDVQTNVAGSGGSVSIAMTNRFVSHPVGGTNYGNIFPTFGHFQIELLASAPVSTNRTGSATTANVGTINKI